MTLNDLQDATYINLETFRKNGTGVKTPLWQTTEGNTMYVWTAAGSWKVKRIRNNPDVRLCESDAQGNPKGEWIAAKAEVLESAAAEVEQRKRMAAKYKLFFQVFRVLALSRRTEHTVIAIKDV